MEVYGARFMPISSSRILFDTTREGTQSLFELKHDGLERSEAVTALDGSSSLFAFSTDFDTAAFINESLARPPEIYLRAGASPARRLTGLNDGIAARIHYSVREASWKSRDGVTAKGWLLEPGGQYAKGSWPLLTHVHGGPSYAFPNAFTTNFEYWPHPFEALASQGIAVFIPNYRGTMSYGREFASPERMDGEPVDDILTGIKYLVASGVADPARLGITGHSHGAWLGPLAIRGTRPSNSHLRNHPRDRLVKFS